MKQTLIGLTLVSLCAGKGAMLSLGSADDLPHYKLEALHEAALSNDMRDPKGYKTKKPARPAKPVAKTPTKAEVQIAVKAQ